MEDSTSGQTLDSLLRFLKKIHVLDVRVQNAGYESIVLDEDELVNIIARRAVIFDRMVCAGPHVKVGQVLARCLDSYDFSVVEEI